MEYLLALFNHIAALSPALEEHLRNILKPRQVARKEIVLREGDIARYLLFVEKGIFRSFYTLNDEEVCSSFIKEQDIFISVHSFIFQLPSYETIEALEDSIVWGISYDQLQFIYKHFPEFHLHRATILERCYSISDQRYYRTRRHGAYDRYVTLIETEPELIRRVHSKFLASYLGLNTSTYSHIKARYAKHTIKNRRKPRT